ncbi:MAG: PEP-CTERM sorting domain-containing protein, partial [Sedimentisphaerales bacterium]|nr:PEP-CTERM sorting domain-containing protein [Sedimentisphaerales bacterium]
WNEYSIPFTVSGEGIYPIYYGSVDGAGNIEAGGEHLYNLNIDYYPPEFSGLPQDGRFYYNYDYGYQSYLFNVSGKVSDTLASFEELTLSVLNPSSNISNYFISPPNLLTGDFSIDFLVYDFQKLSSVDLFLFDPAGHSVSYHATVVPAPSALLLLLSGLAGVVGLRRKRLLK